MSTATAQPQATHELRDEVLRILWTKRRACAADLANELSEPASASEVVGVVQALERDGLVHRAPDASNREYSHPYQTVYELVR